MGDKTLQALSIMARIVTEQQNCVMELIIGDNGMLAHLIPIDVWEGYTDEEDEDL